MKSWNEVTLSSYSNEYDDMSRLKRLKDVNTTATLFDRQYQYNTANQISQITEPSLTRIFGYDNVNRLTSVSNGGSGESYTYDDVGNRTSSHLASSYGYQSGQFNQLISATTPSQTLAYSYDANGNMTRKAEGSYLWQYTWDNDNRLTEAAARRTKVRYRYDALGRRVQRYTVGNAENTKFTYDGQDVLVDDNFGTLTKYVNGDGVDNKLRATTGSTPSYFLADHLGSTNGFANSSGTLTASNNYDSFGNPTNASFPSRYQFTGRELDSLSGLQFSRARFYDPKVGRFVSEDPIGFAGGDVNLYAYVKNRPLKHRDPRGLDDADREWEERFKRSSPTYEWWYWRHNEAADNYGIPDYPSPPARNPTIGFESGGNFMMGFFGFGGVYGIDGNLRSGQVCVYRKWSMRTGLGAYAGAGFKFNFGDGRSHRTGETMAFEEYGLDFGKGAAGKLGLKYADSFSGSGSEIGIGAGPGIGAAVGGDWGQRTNLGCWPDYCP